MVEIWHEGDKGGLLFFFLFLICASPCWTLDLSSPTRDWTPTPAVEAWSPNFWTSREAPGFYLSFLCLSVLFKYSNCVDGVLLNCSVQSLSHVQLFVTPWTAACQASLSITNSRSPPKPMSVVLVMPSNHPILCRPLLLLHQGLFKWVSSSHQVARVLEFQLQCQSFQWKFRTDSL